LIKKVRRDPKVGGSLERGSPTTRGRQWKIGLGLAETIAGFVFAAVAGYFLIAARDLPTFNFNPADPGTAAFPDTMGGALLACSLILAAIGIFRIRTGIGNTPVLISEPLNVTGAIAVTLIYVLAMPYVTYYTATVVWVPLLLLLGGVRSWKWIVSLTVLTLLLAYFIFELVLNVNLP